MGLDMFLSRKTYVKNWNHMSDAERHQISVKLEKKKHPYIKPNQITYIQEEVAYWRKSNAIHRWFVNNVQNGVDDCGVYNVYPKQLQELYDLCDQVIKHEKDPTNTLPTEGGFFFGSTEYGEFYKEDLKRTMKMLKPLLELEAQQNNMHENNISVHDHPEYYYEASW